MYQVIARKYRPLSFSELIGQEHVQKTLINAIESKRIAHGYIFSGQRGTGKTTVARILARCLNCIHGPTAQPCGVCSSCAEITAGNSVDVIEIDAASNRGINEMREIRENVRYRPARDRFKVFIVDEAHQITKEAFNALLKTLEEPPEWVVFILCTTEAHEIPTTIASRCQHFTFRSVDFAEVVDRMKYIAAQEGIEASEEVLSIVALAGEGSVRDSLSALDQAIACCGKTLQVEQIRSLLGMFGMESLETVAGAIKQQDGARMLELVQELEQNGQSLQHFSRELSRYLRNLLVAKISGKPTRLIPATDHDQSQLISTAQSFSEEDLTRYLNISLDLYKNLQESTQPRLHLELSLIKLIQASRLQPIEEALAALDSTAGSPAPRPARTAELRSPVLQSPKVVVPSKAPAVQPIADVAPPVANLTQKAASPEALAPHPTPSASSLKERLYDALVKAGLNFTADAVLQAEVVHQNSELMIRAPKRMLLSLKEPKLQTIASELIGNRVIVRTQASADSSPVTSVEPPPATAAGASAVRERALSHPDVKRFQELFPDAQIRTVRNLNE
jgi:DNA polymerase-3 subunit gamma/tau